MMLRQWPGLSSQPSTTAETEVWPSGDILTHGLPHVILITHTLLDTSALRAGMAKVVVLGHVCGVALGRCFKLAAPG